MQQQQHYQQLIQKLPNLHDQKWMLAVNPQNANIPVAPLLPPMVPQAPNQLPNIGNVLQNNLNPNVHVAQPCGGNPFHRPQIHMDSYRQLYFIGIRVTLTKWKMKLGINC